MLHLKHFGGNPGQVLAATEAIICAQNIAQ
jgi:hypothetical protein